MAPTSVNTGTLLVIGAVFGALAFFVSERFKRANGITPWKLPSWLWGAIGFLSLLLCAILMAIATRQTRSRLRAASGGWPYPGPGTPGAVTASPPGTAAPGAGSHPSGPPPPGTAAPPGWHRDPAGRHRFRYWDGSSWTEHVNDGKANAIDPP